MKPKAQAHFFQSSSHLNPKGKKMKKKKNKGKGQKKREILEIKRTRVQITSPKGNASSVA